MLILIRTAASGSAVVEGEARAGKSAGEEQARPGCGCVLSSVSRLVSATRCVL